MPSYDFLRPRLQGRRFDDGGIPLEFLSDLATLRELVMEVAKWRFLEGNPGRQRSPRGFTEDIHLKLTRLEGGSATPVISLSTTQSPSLMPPNQEYFEEAIEYIIAAVNSPEESAYGVANGSLPRKYFAYFDRIGRNLQEGEYIDFSIPSGRVSARLDSTKRRDLLAVSRLREFTYEVSLRGSVSEADQDRMTFEFQPIYGSKVTGPIPEQHLDNILEIFNGYRDGLRALVHGVGRYDQQNRLLRLESIEHITDLDPLDVPARLDEFRGMNDGWMDGGGTSLSQDGLDWLAESFESCFPANSPLPYTYPTSEGGVQMEWSIGPKEISLEIDITAQRAEWHRLDAGSLEADELILEPLDADGWAWLASQLPVEEEAAPE